jgi:hypothetical protein
MREWKHEQVSIEVRANGDGLDGIQITLQVGSYHDGVEAEFGLDNEKLDELVRVIEVFRKASSGLSYRGSTFASVRQRD